MKIVVILGLCWMMLGASPAFAANESGNQGTPVFVKLSTGFDFSRGDYGLDRDTSLFYFPFSVTLDYRQFRVRAALPLLVSSGPTEIDFPDDVTDTGETRGVGQLQLDLSYLARPAVESAAPYFELTGKLSIPTESRRDLGTGLWAFALQAEIFKTRGRFTPYLSVGRKFYESCGCNRSLNDRFFASAGVTFEWTQDLSVGLATDWLESARGGIPDSFEIVPYASYWLSDAWSIGPYAVFGLTNGSPDYGLGFSLSVRQ